MSAHNFRICLHYLPTLPCRFLCSNNGRGSSLIDYQLVPLQSALLHRSELRVPLLLYFLIILVPFACIGLGIEFADRGSDQHGDSGVSRYIGDGPQHI